jgi:esterase
MAVALAHAEWGAGPPVVILHGLFGSAQNWATIARRLGAEFRVLVPDLRNHGASPWARPMDYAAMADDVAAFMAAQKIAAAPIIGHSMGGKAAMVMALSAPELVARLVVVDIAPVARATVLDPYIEAMASLDLSRVKRRAEADAALKPRIADTAVRNFLLQNLVASDGGLRWRLNLEVLRDDMAKIAGFPEFPAGAAYRGPTLAVRGDASDYVDDEGLAAFAKLFPAFRLVTLPGAGHWLQAEAPDAFLAAMTPFLAEA